jgi:hypothetical protein
MHDTRQSSLVLWRFVYVCKDWEEMDHIVDDAEAEGARIYIYIYIYIYTPRPLPVQSKDCRT